MIAIPMKLSDSGETDLIVALTPDAFAMIHGGMPLPLSKEMFGPFFEDMKLGTLFICSITHEEQDKIRESLEAGNLAALFAIIFKEGQFPGGMTLEKLSAAKAFPISDTTTKVH